MDDILKQILGKLTDMEKRFDKVDERFDRIEAEQKSFRQEVNELAFL